MSEARTFTSSATGFTYTEGEVWTSSNGSEFTLAEALEQFSSRMEHADAAADWLLDWSLNFLSPAVPQPSLVLALNLVSAGLLDPDKVDELIEQDASI